MQGELKYSNLVELCGNVFLNSLCRTTAHSGNCKRGNLSLLAESMKCAQNNATQNICRINAGIDQICRGPSLVMPTVPDKMGSTPALTKQNATSITHV